jgi:hypothetical protein
LEELRTYVAAHHHLPGIPSAACVAEEGYALPQMDGLLLQKIEEQTLYILELESRLQKLEQRIQNR